jgi:hypothetical protein
MHSHRQRRHLDFAHELSARNLEQHPLPWQAAHSDPRHAKTHRTSTKSERHAVHQRLHDVVRGVDPDELDA